MLTSTSKRVPIHIMPSTSADVDVLVPRFIPVERPSRTPVIDRRLAELGGQATAEQLLSLAGALVLLAGLVLGILVDAWYFLMPAAVGAVQLQQVLFGWCPPVELLRAFGWRTTAELLEQRFALKALRGDFTDVSAIGLTVEERARRALDAVRK